MKKLTDSPICTEKSLNPKAIENVMLGIWCTASSFISPIWLTMACLDITGMIYQYDGMTDEGTAGIMGTVELALWILLVLLPDIFFLRRMKAGGRRRVLYAVGGMFCMALLCMALCKWNMVRFVAG